MYKWEKQAQVTHKPRASVRNGRKPTQRHVRRLLHKRLRRSAAPAPGPARPRLRCRPMAAGRRGPRLLLEEAVQRKELSRAAPRLPALLSRRQKSEVMPVLAALLRRGARGRGLLLQRRVQVRGAGTRFLRPWLRPRGRKEPSVPALGRPPPPPRTLRSRPEAQAPRQRFHSPRPCRSVDFAF